MRRRWCIRANDTPCLPGMRCVCIAPCRVTSPPREGVRPGYALATAGHGARRRRPARLSLGSRRRPTALGNGHRLDVDLQINSSRPAALARPVQTGAACSSASNPARAAPATLSPIASFLLCAHVRPHVGDVGEGPAHTPVGVAHGLVDEVDVAAIGHATVGEADDKAGTGGHGPDVAHQDHAAGPALSPSTAAPPPRDGLQACGADNGRAAGTVRSPPRPVRSRTHRRACRHPSPPPGAPATCRARRTRSRGPRRASARARHRVRANSRRARCAASRRMAAP